ncbi:hypothetical protein QBC45DRAFT_398247 [Copromyces sp. CBS 386.78]|nr:hypothetical protein QBC45DRAFT_398247 [Copromyces sp. CBS 386.78]
MGPPSKALCLKKLMDAFQLADEYRRAIFSLLNRKGSRKVPVQRIFVEKKGAPNHGGPSEIRDGKMKARARERYPAQIMADPVKREKFIAREKEIRPRPPRAAKDKTAKKQQTQPDEEEGTEQAAPVADEQAAPIADEQGPVAVEQAPTVEDPPVEDAPVEDAQAEALAATQTPEEAKHNAFDRIEALAKKKPTTMLAGLTINGQDFLDWFNVKYEGVSVSGNARKMATMPVSYTDSLPLVIGSVFRGM